MKSIYILIATLLIWNIILTINVYNLNDYKENNADMWESQLEYNNTLNTILDNHNEVLEYLLPIKINNSKGV